MGLKRLLKERRFDYVVIKPGVREHGMSRTFKSSTNAKGALRGSA